MTIIFEINMILPIIKYGSSTLRKKAFEIDKGDSFSELTQNMRQTLKNAEGIGLAGPQVGELKNIFLNSESVLKINISTSFTITPFPLLRKQQFSLK